MKNRDPLVSCVIASYKRELPTVRRAVESVLSQTYTNIEVLVIDDNRGEEGREYSEKLKELEGLSPLVTIIKTEGGHGAQAARNTGISHSKGEYIAFLDDDDEWLPRKLELQTECLMRHPEAGLCYCDGIRLNDSLDPPLKVVVWGRLFNPHLTYTDLLHEDFIGSTSQAMIPSWVFEKCGCFDPEMPARQDYEMWLRISRSFPITGIAEPLYVYHWAHTEGQLSRSWRSCVRAHKLLYRKYKADIDRDRAARFNVIFHIAHYYKNGDLREGEKGLRGKMAMGYLLAFMTSPMLMLRQVFFKVRGKFRRKFRKLLSAVPKTE